MKTTHRRATLADAEQLSELRKRSILELAPRGMPVALAEQWAIKGTTNEMQRKIREMDVWIAEANGRSVGWVAIREDCLEGLYTDPEYERRGIGTQLLELAEELVRRNGAHAIRAEASWNSEEFYLRRGYEPTGPRPPDGARPITKQFA